MITELRPIVLSRPSKQLESTEEYEIAQRQAVAEMRCQIGVRNYLLEHKGSADEFRLNSSNYNHARNTALSLGVDITGFPKTIRGGLNN